ncbi:hypothetical protein Dsin_004085 [Dipteronia sinensis]|uniref:Phorbol-ester/DAG-type domain-containing protein n=1 Tax=Dipteronia sinensis TaxID=43782 RepID=A0AAE0BAQ4_9ROSI|nr:hypothetical protein Dsin_004085 [Dipteronia sinensis]
MEVIHHESHPDHPLVLKSYDKLYTCDGCKEFGFGSTCRCEKCDFDLHEECAHADQFTSHDFFKNATFEFLTKPPGLRKRLCDGCGREVKGFVYHCKELGWDLHPCCHSLPSKVEFDYVEFRLRDRVTPINMGFVSLTEQEVQLHNWCLTIERERERESQRGVCRVEREARNTLQDFGSGLLE